jgi:AraC family transcriptional regulator
MPDSDRHRTSSLRRIAISDMEPSLENRMEYERRLHRVLAYIDEHLDTPIELSELARIANFSAFHFHRIFATRVGETLGSFVTRRRVEQAAARLASQPRLRVLNVALDVGFGSSEAFARAFKRHFGCTPSDWKMRSSARYSVKSKPGQNNSKASQEISPKNGYPSAMTRSKSIPLQVAVRKQPLVRIAYMRYQGPFGDGIGRFWQQKVYPWLASNGLLGVPRFGVSHDDPKVTAKAKCRYDAGAEVGEDYVPAQGVHLATIPGGLYACAKFKGTSSEIPDTWERILREWLPSSGYQLDARACFEYYSPDGEYDEKTGAFTCELCAPIAKL